MSPCRAFDPAGIAKAGASSDAPNGRQRRSRGVSEGSATASRDEFLPLSGNRAMSRDKVCDRAA